MKQAWKFGGKRYYMQNRCRGFRFSELMVLFLTVEICRALKYLISVLAGGGMQAPLRKSRHRLWAVHTLTQQEHRVLPNGPSPVNTRPLPCGFETTKD